MQTRVQYEIHGEGMGQEYTISTKQPLPAGFDERLRKALTTGKHFYDYDEPYDMYNFRWDGSSKDTMPNISAKVDLDGLYVCLHGGVDPPFCEFIWHMIDLLIDEDSSESVVIKRL